MTVQPNKNLMGKILSMAGAVGAGIFLSLPGLALNTPKTNEFNPSVNNTNSQSDSTAIDGQLLAQRMERGERYEACGGYQGNLTTGGGYYCGLQQLNRQYPYGEMNSQNRTQERFQDNGGSTTGAGYPGNNVRPQGVDNERMNRDSMMNRGANSWNERSSQERFQDNGGSTTGAGYPGNNVRPQGVDNERMNRDSMMNRGANSWNERSSQERFQDNGGSTTGAGYPGNGVTPPDEYNEENQ